MTVPLPQFRLVLLTIVQGPIVVGNFSSREAVLPLSYLVREDGLQKGFRERPGMRYLEAKTFLHVKPE